MAGMTHTQVSLSAGTYNAVACSHSHLHTPVRQVAASASLRGCGQQCAPGGWPCPVLSRVQGDAKETGHTDP